MSHAPVWPESARRIANETKRAINNFTSESRRSEVYSIFSYSVNYSYGEVTLCMDTVSNSMEKVGRIQKKYCREWDSLLESELGWEHAPYFFTRNRIQEFPANTADFKYPTLSTIVIPEWREYFLSDELPEAPHLGRILLAMHESINIALKDDLFVNIPLSSPFRIGVEIVGEDFGILVLRLINLPKIS